MFEAFTNNWKLSFFLFCCNICALVPTNVVLVFQRSAVNQLKADMENLQEQLSKQLVSDTNMF